MSMYDPEGAPSGGSDVEWGIEFPNASAVCKFVEFRRGDEGDIIVAHKPDGAFYQRDDQWYRRGQTADEGSTAVTEDELEYSDYVYARMEIVSPVEVAGGELPLRVKLKGIFCYQRDGQWYFKLPGSGLDRRPNGERYRATGLFQQAKEMGFQVTKLDLESPLCERDEQGVPVYIADEVSRLADHMFDPLEPVHVLEYVIEAKLKQAAEAGHLFAVKTSNISWIEWDSLAALSAEDTARIQAQASEGEVEADKLRQQIREIAAAAEDQADFVARVRQYAEQVQPTGLDASKLLSSCKQATLQHIVDSLQPQPAEGEVSL